MKNHNHKGFLFQPLIISSGLTQVYTGIAGHAKLIYTIGKSLKFRKQSKILQLNSTHWLDMDILRPNLSKGNPEIVITQT